MNFLLFRQKMFDLACFNINQLYAWQPDFNRNNFGHWIKQGHIIRLRNGLYTFPEYVGRPGYQYYFANRMYRPSYISLHSALSFYGLIPEATVQITSISSLKTAEFSNACGTFTYNSVKERAMFGYEPKMLADGRAFLLASPEKALVDLLYIYPFYNSEKELLNLRLDGSGLSEDVDSGKLKEYSFRIGSKALDSRTNKLIKAYGL